jgi:MFS family permease
VAGYAALVRHREVRAVLGAQVVSVLGDQLARVALAVAVFDRSGSPLLSGLAVAATYLPWVVGGPLLVALADRMPRRRVLVSADLVRAGVVALLAVPGVPVLGLVALLAVAELAAPVASAASAAVLPELLPDEDEYVLGAGVATSIGEVGQVLGYVAGGALLLVMGTSGAFLVDAATFVLSALLLTRLSARPAPAPEGRESLVAETLAGIRAVTGSPRLRVLVPLAWLGCAASAVPEALAAPYAAELHTGKPAVGWLLAAVPVGVVGGNLLVGRFLPAAGRERAIGPLALLGALALMACGLRPALVPALGLLLLVGGGTAFYVLVGAVVARETPDALRGRVFGLANTGLMLSQAVAVLVAGALASAVGPAAAMGLLGLVCTAGVGALVVGWESSRAVACARHAARPEAVLA